VSENETERAAVEAAIRASCEAGDFRAATTRALEAYGPEVLSFLIARTRSETDGEEAFALGAEDLWKSLPTFAFRCSVRSWLYTLGRNAANRLALAPHNRRNRNVTYTGQAASAVIAQARSATEIHKRTDVKQKIRELREQLPLEDQTLLILHIDRGLPWRELAVIMHEDGANLDEAAISRESARLRKRFERVRTTLRDLAVEAGLLEP